MKSIFLYPNAGPGGRNYFKQIGAKQDITLNEINLYEGLQRAPIAETKTTTASRTI